MAFKLPSFIEETFTTTGTGAITLGGAVARRKTFASELSNADTCHYAAEGGGDYEEGYGTYSGGVLTRTTIIRSSNANNAVNWPSGTKTIRIAALGPSDLSTINKGRVLVAMGIPLDGFLHGLTLANNVTDATNDIDIAAGVAADATAVVFMRLAASITKRLDAAWAVGSGNGGLDTGSIANTTYHMWLIMRSDTGVVDVLFSASASSPTMPANYDYKRRIGSIVRTGGAIKPFVQDGDHFSWVNAVQDVNVIAPGTSAVTRTVTLPTGIRVRGRFSVGIVNTTAGAIDSGHFLLSDLSVADVGANVSNAAGHYTGNASGNHQHGDPYLEVFTNTSAQIRSRASASGAGQQFTVQTNGWIDTRGKV